MMRGALTALLGLEADLEVVSQVSTAAAVLPAVAEHRPDVALLDIELPDGNGLDVSEALRAAYPRCEVVIVTTFGRPGYLRRARQAGAKGFLVKDGPVEALADAVRRVHAGESVVDPALAVAALGRAISPLSARGEDILRGCDGAQPPPTWRGECASLRAPCGTTSRRPSPRPAPATGPRPSPPHGSAAGSEGFLSTGSSRFVSPGEARVNRSAPAARTCTPGLPARTGARPHAVLTGDASPAPAPCRIGVRAGRPSRRRSRPRPPAPVCRPRAPRRPCAHRGSAPCGHARARRHTPPRTRRSSGSRRHSASPGDVATRPWGRRDAKCCPALNEPDYYLDHFQAVHAGGDQAEQPFTGVKVERRGHDDRGQAARQ